VNKGKNVQIFDEAGQSLDKFTPKPSDKVLLILFLILSIFSITFFYLGKNKPGTYHSVSLECGLKSAGYRNVG
jgi:hypothetical protein